MPFADHLGSIVEEIAALRDEDSTQAKLRTLRRQLTPEMATNAANFARLYPQATADLVAGVGVSGYDYDMPELRNIAELDAAHAKAPWDYLADAVKWTTRNTVAGIDSVYDSMPHTKGLRFATRVAQGEGIGEAWSGSGTTYLAQMTAASKLGEDYTLGEGYFPSPQDPEKTPQYAEAFRGSIDSQVESGMAPEAAMEGAHAAGMQAMPFDVAQATRTINESTRLNRTVGDTLHSTPVSMGRLLTLRILTPDTAPANIISGLIDGPLRIGFDPLNVPAVELTKAVKSRRLLVPDPDDYQAVRASAGKDWAERGQILDGTKARAAEADIVAAIEERMLAGAHRRDVTPDEYRNVIDDPAQARTLLDPDDLHDLDDIARLNRARATQPQIAQQQRRVIERIERIARSEDEAATMYGDWLLAHSRATKTWGADSAFNKALETTGLETARPAQARRQLKGYGRGGMEVSWRPWAQPTFASDFLDSARGQRVVNYLTATGSYDEIISTIGNHLNMDDLRVIHDATDPQAVREVLARNLGSGHLKEAPRLGPVKAQTGPRSQRRVGLTADEEIELVGLRGRAATEGLSPDEAARSDVLEMWERQGLRKEGAAVDLEPNRGVAGGRSIFDDETALGRFNRRYFQAEGGAAPVVLDPTDPNGAIDGLIGWLNNAGVPKADIDDVIGIVVNNPGEWAGVQVAARRANDALAARLGQLGYGETEVKTILGSWFEDQHKARLFNENIAGQPIHNFHDQPLRIVNSQGEMVDIPVPHPVVESQFAERHFMLPSVRDVRMASSRIRTISDKLRSTPLGLKKSTAKALADSYISTWRAFALLRPGWPARVLIDEMARSMASGYSETFASPMSFFGYLFTGKGKLEGLDDVFAAKGGLGVGGAGRAFEGTKFMDPMGHAGAHWTTARYGDAGYNHGLTTRLEQFHSSVMSRTVAQHGVDDATDILLADHLDELRRIADEAGAGSALSRIDDPIVLKAKLREAEFAHARYAGGKGYYRDEIGGEWKDMRGNTVDPAEVTDIDLARLAADHQFVVTDHGSPAVNQFIIDGQVGIPSKDPARQLLFKLQGGHVEGYTFMLAPRETTLAISHHKIVPEGTKVSRFLNDDFYAAAKDMDDPVVMVYRNGDLGQDWKHLPSDYPAPIPAKGPLQSYGLDEFRRPVPAETTVGTKPNTTVRDAKAIEANIEHLYRDGYALPETVAVASRKTREATKWGEQAVQWMFSNFGSKPSNWLIRSPFARTAFWDEMAYFFIYGDDATRSAIRTQAKTAGMDKDLQVMAKRWLDNTGQKTLPKDGALAMEWDEMQDVAAAVATTKTRDLLYDLTKVSNAADAVRLVAPFADAWWELLSRWGRLMNPYKQGGQALRNMRRPQQLASEARTAGWFSEDEHGNEVFNVPLYPNEPKGHGWQVTPELSLDRLMFIDPGSPRSALAPGTGPVTQLAGALLMPLLPVQLEEQAKWLLYGDFAPPNVGSLGDVAMSQIPTPYRRFLQATLADEQRAEYANTIIDLYQVMSASGDPRYPTETKEQADATLQAARRAGSNISHLRIFDAFFMPGQPRHRAQVQVVQDVTDGDADPVWLTMQALNEELRIAEDMFGDRQAAQNYIFERYGVNPLELTGQTQEIKARGVSKEGYVYLREHPELYDHADLTMMAFLPESEDADFYRDAYLAQFEEDEPARERMTPEFAARKINYQKGQAQFDEMRRRYDSLTAQAADLYGRDSATYRAYVKDLDEWQKDRVDDIHAEFWAWGQDRALHGRTERPKYGDYLTEIHTIADPASDAHRNLSDINPEMVGFFSHVVATMTEAENRSRAMGFSRDWWRTSDPELVEEGVTPYQVQLREWFVRGLEWNVARMTEPENRRGAQWIIDRVLQPVLAGYGDDEELIIEVANPPQAPVPKPDTGTQPILAGIMPQPMAGGR